MTRARIDWFIVVTALLFAFGCGGGGCGGCDGMEPIPGGFPAAERTANAGQIRITQSAIAKITADPAAVLGPLIGGANNGVITYPLPASCSGDPTICCPNGQPQAQCGPLEIDLAQRTNDDPRLVLTPVSGQSRIDMTIRARVKTVMKLPIKYSILNCDVEIDTTRDNNPPDLRIDAQLHFSQDPVTGTTRVSASNVSVSQLESGDISLSGNIGCIIGDAFIGAFLGTLTNQVATQIQNTINESLCKSCDSGNVAECSSPFATACTNGTCMVNDRCLQEIGLSGRLRGSTLFASLSPGTTGALDLYEVAGGYATTNNNGIALGLLGGMLPGGSARDRCGPGATPPAPVTIPQSQFFQGNTRPDTNQPYDVGIGLHKSQLDELAYAGYDGGLFCLTIGASTVAQLSTDTIGLLSRSLGQLVEGNSPMAIGLRPQSPPTITLGKNTFKEGANGNQVLDEPLLAIRFEGLEIDFFAMVDEQYIRVWTVVADVNLPIGLQTTGMGELTPVIGDTAQAFTNISVKNSEAITESPEELAALFPTLLELALPQLSGGLSSISLPELGGLALQVTDVTAVDLDQFLAIYANLVPASMARAEPVDTTVEIERIDEPADAIARDIKQWRAHRPPSVTLALGGSAPDLEFSYRLNDGTWSAWSSAKRQTITRNVFWLPGVHKLEVRARRIGRPETIDPEPVRIDLPMGTGNPLPITARRAGFHGQAGEAGCNCETSSGSQGALLALVIGLIVLPRRRVTKAVRRLAKHAWRLGPIVWLAALLSLPGCSCGSNPCGDAECLPGEVQRGAIGRWTSIAADDKRVMVATYDQVLGDLVVVDATDLSNLTYVAVDGIPDVTATYDPSTYRNGIEDPGPNVGAWTSIAMAGGTARVAYQDRDEGTLKYAFETKPGSWKHHVVDAGEAELGLYASLVVDSDNRPAIAYVALGIDDGAGHRMTELRLARATTPNPGSAGDWFTTTIASVPGSCGGLCGSQTCVVGAAASDPQTCVTPSADCAGSCGSDEACVAGACREIVPEPTLLQPPVGTGLWVSLVVLPDGRLAAAYYDSIRRALVLSVEDSKGSSTFTETILDGNRNGADRGMWSSAVVGNDGVVHVAYQDALGDQLMYTTWNGAPGTPEVVDDGQRPDDRPHPVGAAAAIYLHNGTPSIAYQDGMVADVLIATKTSAWTITPLATGPLLDGFSIGVTTGRGAPVAAWGTMDPAQSPPTQLTVRAP